MCIVFFKRHCTVVRRSQREVVVTDRVCADMLRGQTRTKLRLLAVTAASGVEKWKKTSTAVDGVSEYDEHVLWLLWCQ